VNDKRPQSVIYSLDHTIELFTRTPIAHGIGAQALAALREARAQVAHAFAQESAAARELRTGNSENVTATSGLV
jgi:hypothetical protein